MNRGWAEWRLALLVAVGAPVVGLALVVGTTLATVDGPAVLADNWAGRTLMTLLGFAGYALVLFTQLRYFNVVVFFGAFFAFFVGLHMITSAIEERALHERGATATCAVLQVEERVETTTDSEGHTTTRTYYDHTLDCPDAPVTEMTTGSRVVEKGEEIDVRYDTAGRISPRPADAVLHGLPHDYTLRDGDVLTADLAVSIDGWAADSARTVVIGTAAEEDLRITRATEEALEAAIEVARPGNRLGDISAAIWAVARGYGYPVNDEFGGHGLGRTMHEGPHVSNKGRAGRGLTLRPGLTLALEPWFARTTDRIVYDADGWTIRSADGSRTAHSEHTVAIAEDGPLVLTRRESDRPATRVDPPVRLSTKDA